MLSIPSIRWGKPYNSLDKEIVCHFLTGEPVAEVHKVGAGLVQRDAKKAHLARAALRTLSPEDIVLACKRASVRFANDELPVGDGTQTIEEFVAAQSATTGMPLAMCRANIEKITFVLAHLDQILDALTRGLNLDILRRGYGDEGRGVTVSYQPQTPALAAVLPSNSPGVHTLWLPVLAMQIGLVLKPGSQEPWTPFRMASAFYESGIPAEAISIYSGAGGELGPAIMSAYPRTMIFGGPQTCEQYEGNPRVQVHGPGYSKIILGDDVVDDWPQYLDLMADSIYRNGGRSCINCSGVYASRHTKEIAAALAEKLGPIDVLPPDDEEAGLAALTVPGAASGSWAAIERGVDGKQTTHMTEKYGPRLVEEERCGYVRPVILHCDSPEAPLANTEFMFPMASVVNCPQEKMLQAIDYTLVGTVITNDEDFRLEAIAATNIDRLNLGPVPTYKLDWLQPHEGNLVEFLYRNRALQLA